MRLRATIRAVKGKTRHYQGRVVDGAVTREQEIGSPAAVEIHQTDDGVFLYYLDQTGECLTDTWHLTIEAAKKQAAFEFEIREEDWIPVEK
jgi:hypothetical protein